MHGATSKMSPLQRVGFVLSQDWARFLLALVVVLPTVVLSVIGRQFDERMFDLAFMVVGFYFGSITSK